MWPSTIISALSISSKLSAANLALASPPGPPATLGLYSSTLAMGLANAAAIAATAFGTMKGGGAAGGAVGTYEASSATGLPVSSQKEKGTVINVIIEGDMIGDDAYIDKLAERLTEGVEVRDVRLVASNANVADNLY